MKITDLLRGVGENRTLVQTSNQRAFYTFSLLLFVGNKQAINSQLRA